MNSFRRLQVRRTRQRRLLQFVVGGAVQCDSERLRQRFEVYGSPNEFGEDTTMHQKIHNIAADFGEPFVIVGGFEADYHFAFAIWRGAPSFFAHMV